MKTLSINSKSILNSICLFIPLVLFSTAHGMSRCENEVVKSHPLVVSAKVRFDNAIEKRRSVVFAELEVASKTLRQEMHDDWRKNDLPGELAKRATKDPERKGDTTWYRPIKGYKFTSELRKEAYRQANEKLDSISKEFSKFDLVESRDEKKNLFVVEIRQDMNQHSTKIEPELNKAKNGNLANGYMEVAFQLFQGKLVKTTPELFEAGSAIHDVWIKNAVWELESFLQSSSVLAEHFRQRGIEVENYGLYESHVTPELVKATVNEAIDLQKRHIVKEFGADGLHKLKQFQSFDRIDLEEQVKDINQFLNASEILMRP